MKRYRIGVWYQMGGDMSPERYGGVICRDDGHGRVDVMDIQPVINYVGENEATEVGYPLWSKEACYDEDDLRAFLAPGVIKHHGGDESCIPEEWWAYRDPNVRIPRVDRLAIAAEAMALGHMTDEGPFGWSDIVPRRVTWWGGRGDIKSWQAEDADFRRMLKDANAD